ncbi:MAG TPA: hypothetical protein VFV99_16940 [Kofleriaceae bacterium]|nr:hypothetical protein [Kofleriaceae bacterium]
MWRFGVLALVGCDAVFALPHIREQPDVDAADTRGVTGRYGVLVIEPDDFGGYLPPREQTVPTPFEVVLDDGDRPAITSDENFQFAFSRNRDGQSYRLRYTPYGTSTPAVAITAARDLELFSTLFGRYEREPITKPTLLTVTFPQMQQTAYAFSTGLRTSAQINETPTPLSSVAIDWMTQPPLSGLRGLPSATEHDRFYLAEYVLIGGVGAYYAIEKIASAPLTLADGAPATLNMTPALAPLGRCVRLTAGRSAEQDRLRAALPPASVEAMWSIEATPDPMVSPRGGLLLAYEDTTTTSDFQEDVRYPNPFAGERQVVRMLTKATYDLSGHTVTAYTEHFAPLPVTDVCDAASAVTIAGSVAIPNAVTIDDQPAQGSVAVGTGRIAFALGGGGSADYFAVEVLDAQTFATTVRYLNTEPTVTVDPGSLQPGSTYLLRLLAIQGAPGARTGDFRPIAFPYGIAVTYAGPFSVQ